MVEEQLDEKWSNMLNLHLTMDPYFVTPPSSRITLFGWWFEINISPLIKY